MEIRKAEDIDLKQAAIIYLDSWRIAYKGLLPTDFLNSLSYIQFEEKLLKYKYQPDNGICVAFDDHNEMIAFISYTPYQQIESCLLLDSLHVVPKAQNKGVGKSLIIKFFEYAKKTGYKSASVEVIKGNDRAESIYKYLGANFSHDFTANYDGLPINSKLLIWDNLRDLEICENQNKRN